MKPEMGGDGQAAIDRQQRRTWPRVKDCRPFELRSVSTKLSGDEKALVNVLMRTVRLSPVQCQKVKSTLEFSTPFVKLLKSRLYMLSLEPPQRSVGSHKK